MDEPSDTLDLFAWGAARQAAADEPGLARADHPDTSQDAALSAATVSGRTRVMVLRSIDRFSRMGERVTRDFVEFATGLGGNTVRPRVAELIKKGLAVATDETRMTRTGHRAQVLRITPKGEAALRYLDEPRVEK